MIPGPFARADFRGLDDVLAALEKAEDEWGEHFEPPLILRRLVAQGRLGAKSGQGFYPYPQPDEGYENAAVKLDTRGEYAIAWLDNPPANSISPDVIAGARQGVGGDRGRPGDQGDDPRLAEPGAVLRRRRHQGVHEDGRGRRAASCSTARTTCCARWERSRTMTIAAVNGLALRRRLRAGDGLRRPPRRLLGHASASPRSTSASSPASAARSGCRGSSGRPRRSR